MTAGVINAVSDLILALLPISIIRKSAMPRRAKISATLVLLLGTVGSAISVVRLAYIRGLTYDRDFFATGVSITVWSVTEAGICIIAVSLATVRPLFRSCLDGTRRAMTTSAGRSGQKGSHISYSTADQSDRSTRPQRPPRPASPMSFMDRGMRSARRLSGRWPFAPEDGNDDTHIMDDLHHGVVRRASLKGGKVVWKHEHYSKEPLPPPPPVPAIHPVHRQDNERARSPELTSPESPVIPTGFRQSIVRGGQALRNLPKSPSWPKSPPWASSPKQQSSPTQPPPLRHAITSWKPPNSRPSSMVIAQHDRKPSSSQGYLPIQEERGHHRGVTPSKIGPYESVYDPTPAQLEGGKQERSFFHGPTPGSSPPDGDAITALPQPPPPLPAPVPARGRIAQARPGYHPSDRFKPGYEQTVVRAPPQKTRQPVQQPRGEQVGLGVWRMPKGSQDVGRGKMI